MANTTGQITLLPTLTITGALTGWVTDKFKFSAAFPKVLTAQANFVWGSAGTTCKAWLQTSLDEGATWNDIMCFSFTTASKRTIGAVNNFQAAGSGTDLVVPTDGTLAADKVVNGILGNLMRVKITSTGTYAGSTTLTILGQLR